MSDKDNLILENMTEEELALFEDDSEDEFEDMTLAEIQAAVHSEEGDKGQGDEAEQGKADPEPKSEKAESDAKDDEDDGEGDEGEEPAKQPDPKPEASTKEPEEEAAPDPADDQNADDLEIEAIPESLNDQKVNAQLNDITSKMDGLRDQLYQIAQDIDDGEISHSEARQKQTAIEKQIESLNDQRIDLRADFKRHRDEALSTWFNQTVPEFIQRNPIYVEKPSLEGILNETVKQIQRQAGGNGQHALSAAVLEKAHAAVKKEYPEFFATQASPKQEQKADKVAKPKRERETIPTIKDVPGSADTSGLNDKFAALDRLDGEEYEKAFMKLTEAEQAEYMSE